MAGPQKSKKVIATEATTAPAEQVRLGVDETGLPLPEAATPEVTAPSRNPAGIAAEPLNAPEAISVVGVTDEDEELPPVEQPRVTAPTQMVRIRALCSLNPAPVVGKFNFSEITGREARSNRPVHGKFLNGHVYEVPVAVANMCIDRDWAMRA